MKAKNRRRFLALAVTLAMLFTMLPVTAFAEGETYNVTIDSAISGGSLAISPASAAAGDTITVTVTPDEGKQLVAGSLQYTADSGDTYTAITETEGVYSFALPEADVVVTAQFEDIFAAVYSPVAQMAVTAAANISGTISSDQTWDGDNGDTVSGNLTINGSSASNPVVITVTGTEPVTVSRAINITGYVTFCGGGTLKRTATGQGIFSLSNECNLTLEDITLDGGSMSSNRSLARVDHNAATLTLKNGAILKNNINTSANNLGSTVSINAGSLIMDGGEISGNKNANTLSGAVGLFSGNSTFTMTGGTIYGNNNIAGTTNVAICAYVDTTVNLNPKTDIEISGGFLKRAALADNAKIEIAPVSGYNIDSVTVDSIPQTAGDGGIYTITGFSEGLSVSVTEGTGEPPAGPAVPEITVQPVGGIYNIFDDAAPLSVSATRADTGALSYQWYSNTNGTVDPETDPPANGATSTSYTPSTDTAGMTYYYCVVTNFLYGEKAVATSEAAAVEVIDNRTQLDPPVLPVTPVTVTTVNITLAAPEPSAQDASATVWYRMSSDGGANYGAWRTNPSFSGLTQRTTYWFQARYVAADQLIYTDSEPSAAVSITTLVSATLYDLWIVSNLVPSNYTYSVWVEGELKGENISPTRELAYGGSVSSPKIARFGDTVKFIPHFDEGYGLGSFSVNSLNGAAVAQEPDGGYTFTMPANPGNRVQITIHAGTTKTVSIADGIEHGSITTDAIEGFVSGDITVTATPDPGYILKSVLYSTDGGESWSAGTLTFANTGVISISSNNSATSILVKAEFEEPAMPDRLISSEAELRAFAAEVNDGNDHQGVIVALTDDIALTEAWTPIGTGTPFKGVFDGGGHTVSGLNIWYDTYDLGSHLGLFGHVENAVIKNLTVSGTVTATENAANYSPEINAPMNGCYAGGIVGYASGPTRIIDCVSNVDVTAVNGVIGGIVGSNGIDDIYISGCVNYGDLTANKRNQYIGGIAGNFAGMMERCGNYGDVTVTEAVTLRYNGLGGGIWEEFEVPTGYAGGLVGWIRPSTLISSTSAIDGCFNKGNVSGWAMNMGGLAGNVNLSSAGSSLTVTDCYNTGSVSMTAANNINFYTQAHISGLVGASTSRPITLANCYNAGSLNSSAVSGKGIIGALYAYSAADYTPQVTATNCYPAGSVPAASVLGSGFQADVNNINGGNPLLWWEEATPSGEAYPVTFTATPAEAEITVHVYTDAARTNEVTPVSGAYSLQMGQYFYTVAADGYVTENGSFNVTIAAVTVPVTLRIAANVTFTVTPAAANFTLTTGGGQAVAPASSADGVYAFALYAGDSYTYTATATGYNGVTREYTAVGDANVAVALTPSGQSPDNPTITGGQTISAGGVYNLGRVSEHHSVITISTTDPVTLVGTGASLADVYENLFIDCTVEGVNLTLQDLYISNTFGVTNMIDFMGADNHLYFAGTSILDMNTGATGYAMFHVDQDAELTIGGVTPDDTLYFYKREQGAGIGGNQNEYNGKITVTGGSLFMKNSKQGALIGSGANAKAATGSPGDIIIEDGILNLIPISRGAAIGGSAGSAGGATGTNVYIQGGTITINVDYSGSAIGGGGFAEGNDSDGGILHYTGGSIRTFIDHNAAAENLWPGVTAAGVNDIAITADKVNADGANVYLLTFDTTRLSDQADSYTVEEGGAVIYSGGRHTWRYINEDLYKTDQIPVNYTIDNWAPLDDPNLYLYLTGEDHTLIVNGEEFDVRWDSETSTFSFGDISTLPLYTVVPIADQSVYEVGTTNGGISTMTVKAGVSGLKYFGAQIAPVIEHEGREAVVFVHLRGGVQLSINVTRADFDLLDEAQAGFNVQAGDVVRIYIVDDLTNDTSFNPTILQ